MRWPRGRRHGRRCGRPVRVGGWGGGRLWRARSLAAILAIGAVVAESILVARPPIITDGIRYVRGLPFWALVRAIGRGRRRRRRRRRREPARGQEWPVSCSPEVLECNAHLEPQSAQSVPNTHAANSWPGPPSSHTPLFPPGVGLPVSELMHSLLHHGGKGGRSGGGRSGDVGGGGADVTPGTRMARRITADAKWRPLLVREDITGWSRAATHATIRTRPVVR